VSALRNPYDVQRVTECRLRAIAGKEDLLTNDSVIHKELPDYFLTSHKDARLFCGEAVVARKHGEMQRRMGAQIVSG
jgi:hypothetical protein